MQEVSCMQQRFENVPYSLMTCWSLMQRREPGTRLDQCLPKKLDMQSQSSIMRTLRLIATENCFCKYYGYFIFEKFILYFNVTHLPSLTSCPYFMLGETSFQSTLLVCLLNTKSALQSGNLCLCTTIYISDLINYRIDLDRKMLGWVSKGSAKEYSDEL